MVLGVLYFVFVFVFRNKISRLASKTKTKRNELAPIISNFLFHSAEDPKNEQKEYVELKIEIREYLNKLQFRKIISQILFDLQKDVAGDTKKRLFKLYKQLELHHDSFRKLESWRWATVSQGILELAQMQVDESYQIIQKFINDKRPVVRKQAELATVSLRSDGINFLLDTTKHSLSEWQQIKLIEILSKKECYEPPQFKSWLLSQNNDVVLFALRLITYYNQKSAEASITQLIKHKNDDVKIAAIQCVIDFNFKSAIAVLKNIFKGSSNRVKIKILNAITVLGSDQEILFLQEVAQSEKSFIVVSKAQATINAISPEMILPTKDIISNNQHASEISSAPKTGIKELVAFDTPLTEKIKEHSQVIEVEDLEFYDEIEFAKTNAIKKTAAPKEAPNFELKPIEDEYGNSMDELLGLVGSSDIQIKTPKLLDNFENMPNNEKSKLVKMMGDTGDKRELPLLEHITENESDSELRFQAFKTMKTIQQDSVRKKEDTKQVSSSNTQKEKESIFYELYYYTQELDIKLLLLDELIAIGDTREIPFLLSLKEEKDKTLLKKVNEALEILKTKVDDEVIAPEKNVEHQNPSIETEIKETQVIEKDQTENEKIPMELFMLYGELGLESKKLEKKKSSPFDFELSQEFFEMNDYNLNQQNRINE